jgi:hypothetical protein
MASKLRFTRGTRNVIGQYLSNAQQPTKLYRVKSDRETCQRVVGESHLNLLPLLPRQYLLPA